MLNKLFRKGTEERKKNRETELLSMELIEIKEIADTIFERIEKKIKELKTIESSLDEKIETLNRLLKKYEAIKEITGATDRRQEILSLIKKGLKIDEIATILDIPTGEVELVVNFYNKER